MRSLPGALVLLFSTTGCIIYTGDRFGRSDHHDHGFGGDGEPGCDDGDEGGGFGEGEGGGEVDAFEARFAGVAVEVLPSDDGLDLDGDGRVDNNLPAALDALSAAVGGAADWQPGVELQRLVDAGLWVPLMDARDAQDGLEIGLLSGALADDGGIVVHPGSYDEAGQVLSVLRGDWTSSGGFEAGPAPVRLPARLADGTDLVFPLDSAALVGRMSEEGAETLLVGIVPAAELIEVALAPYLGDEGLDVDGDGDADLSTEEVLDIARSFLDDPDVIDIVEDDGTRGISAALWIDWRVADF